MSTVRLEAVPSEVQDVEIPLQPASYDIWDKKYRLKTKSGEPIDADIDATYSRGAGGAAPAGSETNRSCPSEASGEA